MSNTLFNYVSVQGFITFIVEKRGNPATAESLFPILIIKDYIERRSAEPVKFLFARNGPFGQAMQQAEIFKKRAGGSLELLYSLLDCRFDVRSFNMNILSKSRGAN